MNNNKTETSEKEVYELLKKELNANLSKGIFFDSETYRFEENNNSISEDLELLLNTYSSKMKGKLAGWIMLAQRTSHYGNLGNHGKLGYGELYGIDLAKALLNVQSDKLVLKDDQGVLKAVFYDHDGINTCEIKYVTKSKEKALLAKVHFDDLVEYIKKLPSLKIKPNMRINVS